MIRNYKIVRQTTVPLSIEDCWSFLAEPSLVRDWFADVRGLLSQGSSFEFHFGDGDFFEGTVIEVEVPVSLRFSWRFMGAGSVSEIEYALIPYGEKKTLVTVIDRGEHSESGVMEMCEGWDDFLSRLERRVRTGQNSRYRWTESIGCGAVTPMMPESLFALLKQPDVWNKFDQSELILNETDGKLVVTIGNPSWNGQTTTATLGVRRSGTGTHLSVSHQGFDRLPEAIQFNERKRYAGYWADFLTRLEAGKLAAPEFADSSSR